MADIPSFQPSSKLNAKVSIWKGDITKLEVDAIVNSVGGDERVYDYDYIQYSPAPATVSKCIYRAGGKAILEALCNSTEWKENKPVVTHGYALPAKCKFHGIKALATFSRVFECHVFDWVPFKRWCLSYYRQIRYAY